MAAGLDYIGATLAGGDPNDPSQTSGEYRKMEPAWRLISDVLAGAPAVRRNSRYLPKYQNEDMDEYERRRDTSPWRNEFEDSLRALASRPFTKDVGLKAPTSQEYLDLAEDVDGRGNSLTAFAYEAFTKGVSKGIHAIVVDYPEMHPVNESGIITREQERAAGARPYWMHADASDILALYTSWHAGREVIEHVRIRETFVERDGFGEVTGTRIRVYEPGTWQVWEKRALADKFILKSSGIISRGGKHSSVPVVLFFTGERQGDVLVKPPLLDLAEMQIELFRAMSRNEEVQTYASSPLLTANGMNKPEGAGPVMVGPKSVLFGGAGGEWRYINPDAKNVVAVGAHCAKVQDDMRRLGMQPMVARTGSQTATGDSIEAAKAHCVVKAWAMALKDVLEQAWLYTAQWLGSDDGPEVTVYTDFNAVPMSQPPLQALATARADGDISRRTFWYGLQRFDILPADFDMDAEEVKIKQEAEEKARLPSIAPPLPKRDPVTGFAIPDPKAQVAAVQLPVV